MPLSTYSIRTEKVRLSKDNDFDVRAITFPDLAFLVQGRMDELVAIVAKYQEGRQAATRGEIIPTRNIGELITMVGRDFPNLTVEIISSCVYGEEVDAAMRAKVAALPIPVQLDALAKISRLTVEEAGGLGNLIAEMRQRIQDAMTGEASPQPSANPLA